MNLKNQKRFVGPAIGVAGLAFLILTMGLAGRGKEGLKSAFEQYIAKEATTRVWSAFIPVFSFAESNGTDSLERMVYGRVEEVAPLFCLTHGAQDTLAWGAEEMSMDMILKAEAREGNEAGNEEELRQNGSGTKGTQGQSLADLMQAENQAVRGQLEGGETESLNGQTQNGQGQSKQEQDGSVVVTTFIPHTTKLAQVDMAALSDYDTLLKTFYTVDKSTAAGKELLNAEKMASVDMTVSKEAEGPQILIYHTHSQEAFADSAAGDSSTTIVGVGERLAGILTDTYGYQVLHHTAAYDLPSRDDAYSVALPEIEKILDKNPQIQVVIDLHRDAMDESTRLVTQIDGRPTARFMFFNGLSRTKKTGNISYLYNENLEDNLAFSFQMQKAALEYYPGLTRKVYLKAYRYNMHLRPKNLLIELGAQNNTVEEAMNACEPLAHILDMVLSGQG